jgi:hypothetical protein
MLFVAGCPQEQAFPGTTCLQSPTAQSSCKDLRIVHDEQITCSQDVWQVPNATMVNDACPAVQMQKSGRRPVGERLLGNQFAGKVILVKIGISHNDECNRQSYAAQRPVWPLFRGALRRAAGQASGLAKGQAGTGMRLKRPGNRCSAWTEHPLSKGVPLPIRKTARRI